MKRALLVAFVLLTACSPRALRWEYTLPAGLEGSPMTARVRNGGCSGDVRYERAFDDGDSTDGPLLTPGTYGVELEVRNAMCEVVASGCVVVTLPSGEGAVRVDVVAQTPVPLCPGMCVSGMCTGVDAGPGDGGMLDTSFDAGSVDAPAIDANVDAPAIDGGPPGAECTMSTDCPCGGDVCTDGACVPARVVSVVDAGDTHTCAISGGQLFCWGTSTIGEVGGGSFDSTFAEPHRIGALSDWSDVSTQARTTCGVAGGVVRCWGSNFAGQCGVDVATMPNVFSPTAVTLPISATRVAIGSGPSFALDATGMLAGWGANSHSETGAPGGLTDHPLLPSALGSSRWLDVSAGVFFSCGVRDTHVLSCWGADFNGSLGSASCTDCGPVPVTDPMPGTPDPMWTRVALGHTHACGWDAAGALYCWGRGTGDSDGALGAGSPTADSPEPVRVPGLVAAEAGLSNHTCIVEQTGALWCFGPNDTGQLGLGTMTPSAVPMRVAGDHWSRVTAGLHHTCALRTNGALFCWGGGARFVLGTGDSDDRLTPTRICMP